MTNKRFYILLPLLFILPFLNQNIMECNYTALINNPSLRLKTIPLIPALSIVFYMLYHTYNHKDVRNLILTTILTILIPYPENENYLATLHVVIGYYALYQLNKILILDLLTHPKIKHFYLIGILLTALSIAYSMQISGLAQIVYTSFTSITILRLYNTKT